MTHPFRPNPATPPQLDRIRELAVWPGLPQPQASEHVEARIAEGLNVHEAYELIGALGKRIQEMEKQ